MSENNTHIAFDEVSKQVCHLKEVILWDVQRGFERKHFWPELKARAIKTSPEAFFMIYDAPYASPPMVYREPEEEDVITFCHHLVITKYWFIRISSTNKKLFIFVLLEDIHSAWTLSLLLKAIWNCHPKDAVSSPYDATPWSSYDQTPMDHNRAAMPIDVLLEVMEADRKWFRTQEPYHQAEFLSELLKLVGGPIVWAVFHKAQTIFEKYREDQLQNIQECMAVIETQENGKTFQPADVKGKKDPHRKASGSGEEPAPNVKQAGSLDDAHRELEMYLAQWNSIIKSMKDSQKLEEVELSFNDGTKKRMWKVNRPKPEVIETVDYLQLLPLSVAKRVLNYVPRTQLNDCARVNRYWAYLVDEFKAELAARLRIDMDLEKLTELMLRHDAYDQSMETFQTVVTNVSYSAPVSVRLYRRPTYSQRASQRSGATNVFKRVLRDTDKKRIKLPPIRNMTELSDRLDRRGAADDNLWCWCKTVLERYNKPTFCKGTLPPVAEAEARSSIDGVMVFGNIHFPCPLMSMSLQLPLKPPLCKDPTTVSYLKKKKKQMNISSTKVNLSKKGSEGSKRYNLWSRDFSSYTAFKIPNYKSPV